jgi:hypothetical protein
MAVEQRGGGDDADLVLGDVGGGLDEGGRHRREVTGRGEDSSHKT